MQLSIHHVVLFIAKKRPEYMLFRRTKLLNRVALFHQGFFIARTQGGVPAVVRSEILVSWGKLRRLNLFGDMGGEGVKFDSLSTSRR